MDAWVTISSPAATVTIAYRGEPEAMLSSEMLAMKLETAVLGDDWLHGGNGNDFLTGGGGNDVLDGGANDDSISGYFNGYFGDLTAVGGDGNDTIDGAFFKTVDAGAGDDRLHIGGRLNSQVDLIDGGSGNDSIEIETNFSSYSIGGIAIDLTKIVNFETIIVSPASNTVCPIATSGTAST